MLKIFRSKYSYLGDPFCLFGEELKKKAHKFPNCILVLNDIGVEEHRELIDNNKNTPIIRFEGQEPTRYIWNPEGTSEWTEDIIKELSEYSSVITSDPASYYWRLKNWPELFQYDQISFLPSGYETSAEECSSKPLAQRAFEISYAGNLTRISNEAQNYYHENLFEQLEKRNSAVVSFSDYKDLVTHKGIDNIEKLRVIGDSIISLCHNSSYVKNGKIGRLHRIAYSWHQKGLKGHPCFKKLMTSGKYDEVCRMESIENRINSGINIPQLRYRMFEAAFARSLILVRDDSYIADMYFEKNKEYIPYKPEDLNEIVNDILNNPSSYQHIADAGYQRALKDYTVENFIDKFTSLLELLK